MSDRHLIAPPVLHRVVLTPDPFVTFGPERLTSAKDHAGVEWHLMGDVPTLEIDRMIGRPSSKARIEVAGPDILER